MGGKFTAIAEVFHDKTTPYVLSEFKHDAALLVIDQGYSVIEASKSLGIGESALRR
jgi:hypothetical protein